MKGNTRTPIQSQTQGFEAYIVMEDQREKETKRERSMRKGNIQPWDTKESLKRKRNGGMCEWSGCGQLDLRARVASQICHSAGR